MLSDIEIAQAAKMQPITEIAANLGLQGEDVIPYGHYKAKLNHKLAKADKPEGKLILVTAISPTPAGEGKTTTSVGLADAMNALGKKTMLCQKKTSATLRKKMRRKMQRCKRKRGEVNPKIRMQKAEQAIQIRTLHQTEQSMVVMFLYLWMRWIQMSRNFLGLFQKIQIFN